jgi:hypothetical protein
MGSPLRYPAGASVAYHALDAADAVTWMSDHARLVEDVRVRARAAFPRSTRSIAGAIATRA